MGCLDKAVAEERVCLPSQHLCLAFAGMKLFGVGFFASLLGVGMTNTLMTVRQMLDPSFVPLNPPQVGLCAVHCWFSRHALMRMGALSCSKGKRLLPSCHYSGGCL